MDYANLISTPISAADPCGENLEDDNLFYNFLLSSEGTQESYDGKNVIPAEPPDWRSTKKTSLEFLKSTKDLRLIAALAHSVLNTEGVLGFSLCLKGLSLLLQEQWTALYPPLDTAADNGYEKVMERVSAIGLLTHKTFVIDALRNTPLVTNRVLGQLSLKKILASVNSVDNAKPEFDQQQVSAIFQEEEPSKLLELKNILEQCQNHLQSIQNAVQEFEPQSGPVNFDPLQKVLASMQSTIIKYGNLSETSPLTAIVEDSSLQPPQEVSTGSDNRTAAQSYSDQIRSRHDVELCIDKICDYFKKYEPSSPVPVLLMRAKKLINLNFFEIIKEIAPESLDTIQRLGGVNDDES